MTRRASTPEEQPPRVRGGRLGRLIGAVPGAVALGFLAVAIVVIVLLVL